MTCKIPFLFPIVDRWSNHRCRLVFVHDPTDLDIIPVGKQTKNPSHIFYRPCSGIWQPVWLETAPADRITQLDVSADMDGTGKLRRHSRTRRLGKSMANILVIVTVTVHSSAKEDAEVEVSIAGQNGSALTTGSGKSDSEFTFKVDSPKLWSPDSPTLYNVTVTMGDDEVSSYIGFRTVSSGIVDGVQRPLLNGEFVFIFGTLDQGYWPDGLHLPPSREAMVYDLKVLKDFGFNMVRKHVSSTLPLLSSWSASNVNPHHRSRLSPTCSTRLVTRSA